MRKPVVVRKLKLRTRFNRQRRRLGLWIAGPAAAQTVEAAPGEQSHGPSSDRPPESTGPTSVPDIEPAARVPSPRRAGEASAPVQPAASGPQDAAAAVPTAPAAADPDTAAVLAEIGGLMTELENVSEPFRPTSFWAPATRHLIDELRTKGIGRFKSWRSAQQFFYPRYGQGFTMAHLAEVGEFAVTTNPASQPGWVTTRLSGSIDALRDMDVALALLDRSIIDIDLLAAGESPVGTPPQQYRLAGADGPAYGRPYLNYAKILAAPSTVLDAPPRSVLELGGGFGVLGELLRRVRDDGVYVDVDIPPLTSVAAWYLQRVIEHVPVLGPRDQLPGADDGAWTTGFAASLPSWRLMDCPPGRFDVFVNSFSFQEMEPHVVEQYAELVAAIGPRYVVSQNSRNGKPVASAEREIGVTEQTTSDMIVAAFESHGYSVARRFGRPACHPQAELVGLQRP